MTSSRSLHNQVTTLVSSLVPVPSLDGDHRIQDWMLRKGNIVIPMTKIATHSIYMLLQPTLWFHEHANAYFLAKKGPKSIADVVNDEGHLLRFNDMRCRYSLV